MPTLKNWGFYLFVNLGFVGYILGMYYLSSIKDIKDNWATYRCNPIYMPMADDFQENFTYCIQNITTGMMGDLLQPLTYLTSALSSNMNGFMSDINSVRGMISNIRGFISNIFQSIFGVFLNIIIEFQKIIIGIRDLFGKTIGILASVLFLINGSILTINSAWNGPAGAMVRVLSKCFHPDTKIALQNGTIVCMKDIHLGDVLKMGGEVIGTMQIANYDNEEMYVIKRSGEKGEDIFVTGSHVMFDRTDSEYKKVKDISYAMKQTEVSSKIFSCLCVSNNTIPIGKEVFWDWEDDEIIKDIERKKK